MVVNLTSVAIFLIVIIKLVLNTDLIVNGTFILKVEGRKSYQ